MPSAAPDRHLNTSLHLDTKPPRRRSLISLTPLIDVVFILLVFFMLASSFLHWRSIELTPPAPVATGSGVVGSVLVDIGEGGIIVGGQILSLEALAARVGDYLAAKPDQKFVIRTGSGVALQPVVDILDRMTALGAMNISMVRQRGTE